MLPQLRGIRQSGRRPAPTGDSSLPGSRTWPAAEQRPQAGFYSSLVVNVPNWPTLLGTRLFVQGFQFDLQGTRNRNMMQLVRVTIGGR
jgi:hypothetical protein